MIFNPYKELSINPSATDEEVRAAWMRVARNNHPDKVTGNEAIFIRGSHAYQQLRTRQLRMHHLRVVQGLGVRCTACDGEGYRKKQISFTKINYTTCPACEGCGYLPRK